MSGLRSIACAPLIGMFLVQRRMALMGDGIGHLAFARDLLNSDYAGHRLTFVQFAQAPHFNHLNATYNAFDFSGPLEFVRRAADLSDRVKGSL